MAREELVVIEPPDLKFTFELLKQSSCSVNLTNITDQYVAFKVKTTSPKKYCVKPNIGIIKPKSTIDFTVIMQAQRTPPVDMQCKDKFLIQSTFVPYGTMEDEITPGMFMKEEGKYIQENKLRVTLISTIASPDLQPVIVPKEDSLDTSSTLKETLLTGVEIFPPHAQIADLGHDKNDTSPSVEAKEEPSEVILSKPLEEAKGTNPDCAEYMETTEDCEGKTVSSEVQTEGEEHVGTDEVLFSKNPEELKAKFVAGLRSVEEAETTKLMLSKDIEELKEKLDVMSSKLTEAGHTISKLTLEKEAVAGEKESLMQKMAIARRRSDARKVQVGFPPLFVCMVALVGLAVGFLLRA